MKTITTGIRAFFSGMEGFEPKETETIIIVDRPVGFQYMRLTESGSACTFEVADRQKGEMIAYAVEKAPAVVLVLFLTPDYAAHLGLTIADLDLLEALADRLDERHRYAAVILAAYRKNGSFTLTDEQRAEAYEAYKAAQPEQPEMNNHEINL